MVNAVTVRTLRPAKSMRMYDVCKQHSLLFSMTRIIKLFS